MELSFSTAALFPRDTLESMRLLKKAGYSHVELMPQCLHETGTEFAKEAVNTGIGADSIHFPLVFFSMLYNPYPGMIKEARKMIDDIVFSAKILASRVIVVHTLRDMENFRKRIFEAAVFENLRYLCDRAKEEGINIALENSPRGITSDPQGLLQAVRDLGRDNLGPMLDVTESREAGIDPVEFLRNIKPVHIHLSDFSDTWKHLPVGKGSLDWEAIIASLKDKGYEGLLVIEPAYRYFLENALEELKNCLEFMEALL